MPEYEAPMSGWLTVCVDGDQMTKVSVEAGEEISVDIEAREDGE